MLECCLRGNAFLLMALEGRQHRFQSAAGLQERLAGCAQLSKGLMVLLERPVNILIMTFPHPESGQGALQLLLALGQLAAYLLQVLHVERRSVRVEPRLLRVCWSVWFSGYSQEFMKVAIYRVTAEEAVSLITRCLQACSEQCLKLIDGSDGAFCRLDFAKTIQRARLIT